LNHRHQAGIVERRARTPQIKSHSDVRSRRIRANLVHNAVMRTANKKVRQSVSLPANIAAHVRTLAKARRLSANRMLLELIENGIQAEKRKEQEFFDLAERFRSAADPEEVEPLSNQMGRMLFGS
jgi:hypothetical protein